MMELRPLCFKPVGSLRLECGLGADSGQLPQLENRAGELRLPVVGRSCQEASPSGSPEKTGPPESAGSFPLGFPRQVYR